MYKCFAKYICPNFKEPCASVSALWLQRVVAPRGAEQGSGHCPAQRLLFGRGRVPFGTQAPPLSSWCVLRSYVCVCAGLGPNLWYVKVNSGREAIRHLIPSSQRPVSRTARLRSERGRLVTEMLRWRRWRRWKSRLHRGAVAANAEGQAFLAMKIRVWLRFQPPAAAGRLVWARAATTGSQTRREGCGWYNLVQAKPARQSYASPAEPTLHLSTTNQPTL